MDLRAHLGHIGDGTTGSETTLSDVCSVERIAKSAIFTDTKERADDVFLLAKTQHNPVTSTPAVASKPQSEYSESIRLVKWGVHWLVPTKALALYIVGVALAVGHHCYYHSLAGTKVIPSNDITSRWDMDRQEWKIRFGTAFAFLAKTCLAAVIGIAYNQYIWVTCKRNAYSISGLNALFSATNDILALADPELALKAKISTLLAVLVWMLPLSALITPATLTVISVDESKSVLGWVPQVEFNPPIDRDSLSGYESDGLYVWNGEASPLLTRISSTSASSMSILPMPIQGPNATYVLNFYGPSLKCEQPNSQLLGVVDEIVAALKTQISESLETFPIYTAFTPNLEAPRIKFGNNSVPNYISFVNQCILGGSVCKYSSSQATNMYTGRSDPLVIRSDNNYTCALKETLYSVRFRSLAGQTNLELISFKWLDGNFPPYHSYSAFGMALAKLLTGTYFMYVIRNPGRDSSVRTTLNSARTSIGSTALMGCLHNHVRLQNSTQADDVSIPKADIALAKNKTLGELVEELSRNLTLSLFSSDRLWSNTSQAANITYENQVNHYAYNPHNLWAAYGTAILMTVLSVGVGAYALYLNGVSYDVKFSTIVATTRDHEFNEMMAGSSLGALPMGKDILRRRLRFGVVEANETEDKSYRRVGFGLETNVRPLRRGEICY